MFYDINKYKMNGQILQDAKVCEIGFLGEIFSIITAAT